VTVVIQCTPQEGKNGLFDPPPEAMNDCIIKPFEERIIQISFLSLQRWITRRVVNTRSLLF